MKASAMRDTYSDYSRLRMENLRKTLVTHRTTDSRGVPPMGVRLAVKY
jgi:hypothetical protein